MSEIRYGLIGGRLSYSYSNIIHRHLMERYPHFRDGEYHILEMPQLLFPRGYRGFNITNPYKDKNLVERGLVEAGYGASTDRIGADSFFCGLFEDERAAGDCYREILEQAVNTVSLDGGRYVLYNTDIYGFCLSYGQWIREADRCFVLGTGATSKMVRTLMRHLGIPCTVAGREGLRPHLSRVNEEVADTPPVSVSGTKSSHLSRGNTRRDAVKGCKRMLVNCTPVGTAGNPDPLTDMGIEVETLSHFDYVADLVYNPEATALVSMARGLGKEAKSGLQMLVAQAVMAQAIWNSAVGELREVVEETLDFLKKSV